MIDSKLRFPHRKIPEPTNTTPPPRPNAAPPQPPTTPPRRHNNNREHRRNLPPSPPPSNLPSPPINGNSRIYNPKGVGHNMFDSLAILGLTIEDDIKQRDTSEGGTWKWRESTTLIKTNLKRQGETGRTQLSSSNS